MDESSRAAPLVSREELARLVAGGATFREIVKALRVDPATARKYLKRYDLETRSSEALREARRESDATAGEDTCKVHGITRFVVDSRGSWRCLACRSEAVSRRRRKVKRILVDEAGGACQLCGYTRCPQALHFHHRDPHDKEFGLSFGGFTIAIDKLRREARKCALLCSNCHAEVEAGIVKVPAA